MAKKNLDGATPEDLIPRMGNLPISNARYFQSAVIRRVSEPELKPADRTWNKKVIPSDLAITAIAYNHQGTRIATGDVAGKIWIYNSKTFQNVNFIYLSDEIIRSLAFSPDGSKLAIVDGSNKLYVLDADEKDKSESEWKPKTFNQASPSNFIKVYSTSKGAFCAGPYVTTQGISFFDLINGKEYPLPFGRVDIDNVTAVDAVFLPNEIRMLLGYKDGTVKWNAEGQVFPLKPLVKRNQQVASVAFRPDGSMGLIAGEKGHGRWIYPKAYKDQVLPFTKEFEVGVLGSPLREYLFNADGSQVMIVCEKSVSIWEIELTIESQNGSFVNQNQPPIFTAAIGRSDFRCFAFSSDAAAFAAGGHDKSLTVFSMHLGNPIEEPFKLFTPAQSFASARPAEGVLLTHEQSWMMEGIALGELLHSTSLAPGEITQIAVSNHTQSVMQNSVDTVAQSEDLSQRGVSAGDLAEQEKTKAVEAALGGTTAASASATQSVGTSASLLIASTSSGYSHSQGAGVNVSYSSGSRHVSDESNQSVHQNTVQAAHMARSRSSASVREVSESDSLELQTRVVANYNHMHALTLQYYEVIQVQRLTTKITDAHRLLFVPMQPIDFTTGADAAFSLYSRELAETLRALGFPGAAFCTEFLMLGNEASSELRQHRVDRIWTNADTLKQALADLNTAPTNTSQPSKLEQARAAAAQATNAVLQARDALRKAKDPKPEVRNALRRILNTATATEEVKAASDELETLQPANQATLSVLQQNLDRAVKVAKLATVEVNTITTKIANVAGQLYEAENIKKELANLLVVSVDAPVPVTIDFGALKERIKTILANNQLAVNQGLWMRLNPSIYATLLEGKLFEGKPIDATLDPVPVAVTGSYVGFRWPHSDPAEVDRFRHEYVNTVPMYQDAVSIPTGGVFGEAVLGESNSADRIDFTRFWNWKDALPPIRPAQIDPLGQPADAPLQTPTLATAPASTINLGPISFPDVSSGISNITGALQNPDLFADLSGTKNSAEMTRNAMQLTGQGALDAAQKASENFKQQLDFQRKMASAAMDMLGGEDKDKPLDVNRLGAVLNSRDDAASADDPETSGTNPSPDGTPDSEFQVSYEAENNDGTDAEEVSETTPEVTAEDQKEGTEGTTKK